MITRALAVSSCFFTFSMSALGAQGSTASSQIVKLGSEIRFQQGTDTTWTTGRVVMVGNCLAVAPSLPPNAPASDAGFMVTMFSAAGRVEVRVGSGTRVEWRAVPDAELSALRSCSLESR